MVYQQYDEQQVITMFPSDCLHQRQQSQHQPQVAPQQRLGGTPYNVSTSRAAAMQHAYYGGGYLPTAESANDDMMTSRQSYVHSEVTGRQHAAPAQYYHPTEYQPDQSPTSGMHQSWTHLYPTATGVDPSEQSSAAARDQWRSGPPRYASSAGSSLYSGESEQLLVMLSPSHHSNHSLVPTAAGNGASADRSPLGADNPSVVGNYAYPHSVTDLQTLASSPTALGSNAAAEINKYQSQQQQHHRSVTTTATAAVDVHTLRDSGGSDARSGISASSQQQQQHMKSAVRSRLCGAVGDTLRSTHGAMGTGQGWSHSQQVAQQQHPAPFDWMKKQTYPAVTPSGKTRTKDKYRIVYTELQKVELEKEFLYNQYITIQRKAELAGHIGLSDRQVKIWFQNRRAKERKHKRKREENSSLRTSTSSSGGLSVNGSGSISSAPPQLGGAKSAPVMDSTPRLHQQLQQQQQHRCSDVIKKESGHELMTSSIAPSNLYSIN